MALKITKDTKMITLRSEEVVHTKSTVIGSRMFANRDALVEVVIPEGITRIEKDAFLGCDRLEKVILPESVGWIECWYDDRHAVSQTLFRPFTDLPKVLKEGREVDLYPETAE